MPSKTFETLSTLQNYADLSEKAHGELKSCIWQLTKSRRNVRSGIIGVDSATAYTAELVREELRAQIRVVDSNKMIEDADLIDENSDAAPKDNRNLRAGNTTPQWKSHNVLLELEQSKGTTAPEHKSKVTNESTGIRNRKKKNQKEAATEEEPTTSTSRDTSPSSSWTIVQKEDLDSDAEEDEKLLRTDPIKLFGGHNFTARELKVAQRNAEQSLNTYIQAANEAAKILSLLKEAQK